jgi:hypothetical protein
VRSLDRPRPHQRHFDDEVVELARLESREHRHLRAALDLEDPHRVRSAERVVDDGVFLGDERELLEHLRRAHPFVVLHERQHLPQRGQHPQPQDIHLEEAERIEVVLVPRDDGAAFHRGRFDRRDLDEG